MSHICKFRISATETEWLGDRPRLILSRDIDSYLS